MTGNRLWGVAFALVLVALAVWSLRPEPAAPPPTVADKMKGLDLAPYDRARFPKLYAALGEEKAVKDVQAVRQDAAVAAAKDDRCDRVASSDYADQESSDGEIAAFADCANGFRIWYSRERGVIRTSSAPSSG